MTSVSLLAQVPGTALLAALLVGEPLSGVQIAGTANVLAGIYTVNRMETIGSLPETIAADPRSTGR